MQTNVEQHRAGPPARPPILKRVLAGLVLIVAVALALKIVIGLVMTVFWVVVAAAVVIAVLWALNTIL